MLGMVVVGISIAIIVVGMGTMIIDRPPIIVVTPVIIAKTDVLIARQPVRINPAVAALIDLPIARNPIRIGVGSALPIALHPHIGVAIVVPRPIAINPNITGRWSHNDGFIHAEHDVRRNRNLPIYRHIRPRLSISRHLNASNNEQ